MSPEISERSFEEAIDCGNVCSNTPRRLCGRGDPLARGSLSPTITTRSTPQEGRPAASPHPCPERRKVSFP